jgi:hypothetical protein
LYPIFSPVSRTFFPRRWVDRIFTADSDNLPSPEVIAQEIVDDLEAALEQFRLIAADLNRSGTDPAA